MSCSGAAELSSRVPWSLGCSCHLISSLSSHDHITMTSHTRTLSMTWSSTLSILHLQLNLRMSEAQTCQLPTMTHSHRQHAVHGGGLQKLMPNPFWLSLAQRRARVISDPCSLTPTLAQPFHNPVSVPFFRLCLWICVGSCSLVGTWLIESQSTHTHIKPNTVHMRHCPWQSDVTLQSALPRHRRPHTLCIACKVACTFSPPSASSCLRHS